MAKTRKHRSRNTSRRIPRRTKNTLRNIIYAVVIIAAAAAAFDSWRTAASSPVQTAVTTADSLRHVIIPADIPQQIIHYPGFTVSFNPEAHQPNWVAWELLASETDGESNRESNFTTDYNVEGCSTTDDYRGSGYDRGHMAPAGDMKWSAETMRESFLMTNICPQAGDLNRGAWKKLEEKCRQRAVADSAVVIVCGPIFSPGEGVERIGKTGVAVPRRFFKVVLSPYTDPPKAIGFIMPNGYVKGGMQTHAVSVDSVEAVTGHDFFSALPDEVENRIEAECDFSRWSRIRRK